MRELEVAVIRSYRWVTSRRLGTIHNIIDMIHDNSIHELFNVAMS